MSVKKDVRKDPRYKKAAEKAQEVFERLKAIEAELREMDTRGGPAATTVAEANLRKLGAARREAAKTIADRAEAILAGDAEAAKRPIKDRADELNRERTVLEKARALAERRLLDAERTIAAEIVATVRADYGKLAKRILSAAKALQDALTEEQDFCERLHREAHIPTAALGGLDRAQWALAGQLETFIEALRKRG